MLLEWREILLGLCEAVLDRLEHGRDRRDRCSEVVARRGDELAACVEEALELGGHRVERASESRELARATCRGPDGQVSLRQPIRRSTQLLERSGDRRRQHEGDRDRACCSCGRNGEDLHVGAHVEHHPAREQHGRERQEDGKQPERGELRPHRRQAWRSATAPSRPDGERREGDDDREMNHGTNL